MTDPSASSPPSLAIVIPAYDAAGTLDRVLGAAAREALSAPGTELVVVDAGSTDGTAALCARRGVRVVRTPGRAGPAEARNVGVDATEAEVVLFLDADCVPSEGVVDRVRRTFAAAPELVALSGSYDDDPADPGFFSRYMNLRHHATHQAARRSGSAFWAGCGAVRRSAFRAAGGFDAVRYPRPAIEDIELGTRLAAQGELRIDPELQVKHLKRWTLASVVATDVFARAAPWSALIVERGELPNDLNLRWSQRIATAIAPFACVSLLATPVGLATGGGAGWLAAGVATLAVAAACNAELFVRFRRSRGWAFAALGTAFHQLHLVYAGATFVVCAAAHAVRGGAWATTVALFASALAVRALPWRDVFVDGRVVFIGADPYYHARRVLYATTNFLELPAHDPYVGFPLRVGVPWPPYFDGAIAALVRPLAWVGSIDVAALAAGDTASLERVLVWIPPLLGAATVAALHRIALRHFDASVACLGSFFLAVLAGHFHYSQISFLDHHVAVSALATLLFGASLSLVACVESRRSRAAFLRAGVALGVLQVALLLVWPGGLLLVGTFHAFFFALLLGGLRGRTPDGLALGLLASHVVTLVGVIPAAIAAIAARGGEAVFAPSLLSAVQPLLFGAMGLACVGFRAPGRRRVHPGALAMVVALPLVLALLPGLRPIVGDVWALMVAETPFMATIGESRSLFGPHDGATASFAVSNFSMLLYVVPFALAIGVVGVVRGRLSARHALLFSTFTILALATLLQRRFMNSLSPFYALFLGWSLVSGARFVRSWMGGRPADGPVVAAMLAALTLVAAMPMFASYEPHLWNQLRALRGEEPIAVSSQLWKLDVLEIAEWLRTNSPETSGYLDAAVEPEYGVLGPWSMGHPLRYVSRRPPILDNFGTNFDAGRHFFTTEDRAWAEELIAYLRGRYVIADLNTLLGYRRSGGADPSGGAWGRFGPESTSTIERLYWRDGSEYRREAGSGPAARVAAADRYRLVYESRILPIFDEAGAPTFKLFERVEGARLVGRATPGCEIVLSLPMRSNRGRAFRYASSVVAGDAGAYEFTVPYSNLSGSSYLLSDGDGTHRRVAVTEAAVQSGARVAAPTLCPSGGAGHELRIRPGEPRPSEAGRSPSARSPALPTD